MNKLEFREELKPYIIYENIQKTLSYVVFKFENGYQATITKSRLDVAALVTLKRNTIMLNQQLYSTNEELNNYLQYIKDKENH